MYRTVLGSSEMAGRATNRKGGMKETGGKGGLRRAGGCREEKTEEGRELVLSLPSFRFLNPTLISLLPRLNFTTQGSSALTRPPDFTNTFPVPRSNFHSIHDAFCV